MSKIFHSVRLAEDITAILSSFWTPKCISPLEKALAFFDKRHEEDIRSKFLKLLEDYDGMRLKEQHQPVHMKKILVREPRRIFFVKTEDVVWIEAARDYLYIHTNDKKYLINDSLNNLEQKLNPTLFLRIHRSHIINLDTCKSCNLISTVNTLSH